MNQTSDSNSYLNCTVVFTEVRVKAYKSTRYASAITYD